eukprot:2959893-Prymnesium_polylepis.1
MSHGTGLSLHVLSPHPRLAAPLTRHRHITSAQQSKFEDPAAREQPASAAPRVAAAAAPHKRRAVAAGTA